MTEILMLVLLPLLLAISGFVSGSETALFSLTEHQRLEFRRSGSIVGGAITQLLAETRDLLITLMLSNMVVNVLYFIITTVLMIGLERRGHAGALGLAGISVGVLLLLILVGEVLPKLVAVRLAPGWSRVAAVPLLVVHRTIGPVRLALNLLVITPLARLIAPSDKPRELSSDDLATLLELSQQRGVIDHGEEQMLQQVLELGQLKVRNLMTPRVNIEAFDLDDEPAKLVALMARTRLSHIPVYVGDLDHIEGIAYARQVLLRRPTTTEQLKPLLHPARFVPELQRADQLLLDMRKSGTTIAVAVDEYGGTAGLVTLEDVVEQMVGHIAGPYESAGPRVTPLERGRWRVSADLSIQDWRAAFGDTGQAPSVSTIGGLVMARLGRLPKVGDKTTVGNILIEVESMEQHRLNSLLLTLQTLGNRAADHNAQKKQP